VLTYLASLSPSAVDAEVGLLCRGVHDDTGLDHLANVLARFRTALHRRHHFDALQGYVHRLIQHHAEALATDRLRPAVAALHAAQRDATLRVRALFQESLCLLDFFLARSG